MARGHSVLQTHFLVFFFVFFFVFFSGLGFFKMNQASGNLLS